MNNRNILIPVKFDTYGYTTYKEYIKPYLDVFGMPYDEVSTEAIPEKLKDSAALILLAQPDIELSEAASVAIAEAVFNGCGLVTAYSSLLSNSAFSNFAETYDMPLRFFDSKIRIEKQNYITRYHTESEYIQLYSALGFYKSACLKNAECILSLSNAPLLEIARYGKGKIAHWSSVLWASLDILGPVHGMDDIFRDSIVWAAQKPFVMKGMPAFVGMRVDDVWGAWRDVSPDNPLLWIDIANEHKLRPWLGVFQDNTTDKVTDLIRNYVKNGRATAFPHAFAGCEWVISDLPEDWLWFDHRNERPWPENVMKIRAARAKDWFDKNGIPLSKVALAHYYETSECALPIFLDWGCEFVGIQMPADASYFSGARLNCGPYRKYTQRACGDSRPVYYADYLSFPHNPRIDKKLFNCVTEIRDICGYELAPTNDVEATIKNGIAQLRRAITSGIPSTVFTHESMWIQRITPKNWEAIITGITEGVSDLNPVYDTLDNINKYVRASYNIKIEKAAADELGNLNLSIKGVNDMDTKCFMFTEENGEIIAKEHIIPKAGGVMCPCNIY